MRPDAILMSDVHIRGDIPKCRTDNFISAQAELLRFIADQQEEHDCPILHGGDTFHVARMSQFMERWLVKSMPNFILTVAGNHDLPYHSLSQYDSSSLSVLEAANKLTVLNGDYVFLTAKGILVYGFPWGRDLDEQIGDAKERMGKFPFSSDIRTRVAIVHHYVYKDQRYDKEEEQAVEANRFMEKFKDFDLIVSGHNHHPFTIKRDSQLLVNPGSMTRQKTDEDYTPRVYLWYADWNRVEPVYLPVRKGAISKEHVRLEQERMERSGNAQALVSNLVRQCKMGLDLDKNFREYFGKKKTRREVQEEVYECISRD